jgi:hypothetical protein
MIACRLQEPAATAGWRRFCAIETNVEAPAAGLVPECPAWSETIIERSFLKCPEALAMAIGLRMPQPLLALRQVDEIDLYLRAEDGLHLFEIKRPSAHLGWQKAVGQIADYWTRSSAWLRKDQERVGLWVVCPVRWSKSRGEPKIPAGWSAALASVKETQLAGAVAVDLSLVFYTILRAPNGLFMFLWRADEDLPQIGG